jgi:hypothetical protein
MESYRMGFKRFLGLCLIVALGGCAAKDKGDDTGGNMQSMNPVTGSGGSAANPGGGSGGSSGGANTGSGGKGNTGAGNPMGGGTGGGGSTDPMGGGSGMGSMMGGGAGDGGAGTTGGGSGGMGGGPDIDTSSFLKDCKATGENWGKPSQLGPCSSGETIYGVKVQFGPYGASSEHDVGKGFESGGTDDTGNCNGPSGFINSFGADPVGSADLMDTHMMDFSLYTVFYPGAMPEGEKFPLITWGNGTCAMPEGYGTLLRYVASFGYIVVAAQDREVGTGASMLKAVDFMLAENDKEGSKYYHHIDPDKIGAMGHSQGAGATVSVSTDSHIKAIIAFNSGTSSTVPFLDISGDRDILASTDPSGIKNDTEFSQQKGAWLWYHQIPDAVGAPPGSTTGETAPGHLTLMMEPERVMEPTVAWWDMILKGKEEAKKMFLGADCTLCSPTAYPTMWPPVKSGSLDSPTIEYGHNSALQ